MIPPWLMNYAWTTGVQKLRILSAIEQSWHLAVIIMLVDSQPDCPQASSDIKAEEEAEEEAKKNEHGRVIHSARGGG